MKGKDPAFLFYTDAFLVGTMEMTDAEVGRYLRLLLKQHSKGHVTEADIKKAKPIVREKFIKAEDGFYYNPRMSEEIEKRKKYSESRRHNGLNGGRPPKDEKPYGKHMDSICEPYENHTKNKDTNTDKDTDNTNTTTGVTRLEKYLKLEEEIFGEGAET